MLSDQKEQEEEQGGDTRGKEGDLKVKRKGGQDK
jgi:hypothetical protein